MHLIPIHTLSFVGRMISGYDLAVRDIVKYFARKEELNGKLNVITGWARTLDDVTTLKHLL
ncbi:MAG: nitrogenase component 1 [Symbiopectobacterium sp.]